jgi:hypothetical protein
VDDATRLEGGGVDGDKKEGRGRGRGALARLLSAAPASVTKGMEWPAERVGRGVRGDDKPVDAAPVLVLATVVVVTSSCRG